MFNKTGAHTMITYNCDKTHNVYNQGPAPYFKTPISVFFLPLGITKEYQYTRNVTPILTRSTQWGRVTHIYVNKLTIIGSDNGLSPGRRQAIIWTNAGILSIGPWGINFNEISIEIHAFSSKKIHLKMSSGKWWPFCLGFTFANLRPMAAML